MRVVPIPWTRVTFVNTGVAATPPPSTLEKHFSFIVASLFSNSFRSKPKREKLLRKLRFEIPPFRISYPSEKNDRRRRNREIGRSLERGTIVSHRWSHRLDDEAMRRISEIPGTWKTPPASVFFSPSCNQEIRCYLSEVIASLKIYHRICVTATFCADDVIKGRGERRQEEEEEEGVEM